MGRAMHVRVRDDVYRANLAIEASACRRLWATVVLSVVSDAAREVAKCRADGRVERADTEIAAFRAWIRSRDGNDVLRLAGIDRDQRVIDSLLGRVQSGDTTFMYGAGPTRPYGAGIGE